MNSLPACLVYARCMQICQYMIDLAQQNFYKVPVFGIEADGNYAVYHPYLYRLGDSRQIAMFLRRYVETLVMTTRNILFEYNDHFEISKVPVTKTKMLDRLKRNRYLSDPAYKFLTDVSQYHFLYF